MSVDVTEVNRPSVVAAAALLTSTCLLPAMLMPYLVGAVAQTVTAEPRQLGFVTAAVLGGPIALMAVSVVWVRRYSWRRLAGAGLVFAALGYALAASMHTFGALLAAIAFGSTALAVAYAPPICLLSDTSDPDRNFGYAFFLQIVASGITGVIATALAGRLGPRSLYVLIAGIFVLSLALVPLLPRSGLKHEAGALHSRPSTAPIWMGLAGMLFLNAGPTAVWAFFERIGHSAGFSEGTLGNIIAVALLAGAPGSLLSAAAARRFGRLLPLALSILLMIVTFAAAILAPDPVSYLVAGILFQFLLNFSLSFQYGALSVADTSGRLIVLAPTFQGIGGIGGPILAGLVMQRQGLAAVAALSALYNILGLGLLMVLCRRTASGQARELPITPR